MQEPRLARGELNQTTLVGTINLCSSLAQYHPAFIGAVNVLRSQDGLPASLYSAFWYYQVVVVITFIDLGAFRCFAHIDNAPLIQEFSPIGPHAVDNDRTRTYRAVSQVGLAIVVPERTGILPLAYALHLMQRRPGARRIFCCTHIQALIGGAKVDVKEPALVANGRRPAASAIGLHGIIPGVYIQAAINTANQRPVHQIP